MSLDDKLTFDEFISKIASKNCRLSSMHQAKDGTWFVGIHRDEVYYYGRDKDLGLCLRQAWRQVAGGARTWLSYDDLVQNKKNTERKKVVERVRLKPTVGRVRLRG